MMNKIVFDRVPERVTCVDLLNVGSKAFICAALRIRTDGGSR